MEGSPYEITIISKSCTMCVKKSFSINGLRLSINQAILMFCIRLAPLVSQVRSIKRRKTSRKEKKGAWGMPVALGGIKVAS